MPASMVSFASWFGLENSLLLSKKEKKTIEENIFLALSRSFPPVTGYIISP